MSDSEPRHDLVEPEGVNAGSSLGERDRRPDGDVEAGHDVPEPGVQPDAPDELVGVPDPRRGTPGQELGAGEG